MASPSPSPTLARPDDVTVGAGPKQEVAPPLAGKAPPPPPRPHLSVAVLCLINLLNYMDRFTVAGVLPEVEDYFGIGDSSSGLLQTVFISSYLVLAPLFGFLGDRHSRKRLLALGLALWSGVTLATSFVPPQHFGALLAGRALVGVGEAAYSTLAPTLVADLFRGPARSRALGGFYLAVPLGSGLGYIAGSKVKDLAADWRWALRVTPVLGLLALLLLLALVSDPPRGGLDGAAATLTTGRAGQSDHGDHSDHRSDHWGQSDHSSDHREHRGHTTWGHDLRELSRNRTLVLSTLGFTSVAFVTGALALWAPAFLFRARLARGEGQPCRGGRRCQGDQSLLFGALTCGSGVLGVGLGAELSRRLRPREPRADPLLCAGGLLGGAPCLLLALLCAQPCPPAAYVSNGSDREGTETNWDKLGWTGMGLRGTGRELGATGMGLGPWPCPLLALLCAQPCPPAAYVFIFLGETLLSLNWAIVADILLYVVPPGRRSTAEALQIVASHLLGDAGSPYLVGLLSDALGGGAAAISYQRGAGALLRALLLLPFAAALGGAAFLAAGNSLPRDRRRARREARGLPPDGDDDDDDDDDGDHHSDPAAIVVPPAAGGRTRRVPVAHVLA